MPLFTTVILPAMLHDLLGRRNVSSSITMTNNKLFYYGDPLFVMLALFLQQSVTYLHLL